MLPKNADVPASTAVSKQLQGMALLMERISGKTIQDLSTQYSIPKRDLELLTSEAWESATVESLRAQMLEKLSTMVLAVYEQQLRVGSLDAARDIAMSIGLLKKPATVTVKEPVTTQISSVEDYRLSRQSRKYRALEEPSPLEPTRKISTIS